MFPLRPHLQGCRDLIARYRAIYRHAWDERAGSSTPARLPHELAFLPAHLELIESPPHPAPLWTARLLIAAVVLIALIAAFGRLDIVAVAPGQLTPNASLKVVQPAVTGVVRRIFVQDGERVAVGQPLLELDPTQASADATRAKSDKMEAQLAIARAKALLIAQTGNSMPRVATVAGATPERQRDTQTLAEGTFQEYQQKVAALQAELQKQQAELDSAHEEIAKLRLTAPLAEQEASDYQQLAKDRYVAAHDYLDKQRAAIEQAHELAAEESHAHALEAGIEAQRRDIAATRVAFSREQGDILNKSEQEASQDENAQIKADARERLMLLKSPVDGIVQQLRVHTVGGVVTSAERLMEVVPDDTLEVEAHISNKDIGFVNPGQAAVVKITTFPYTRYGYLTGTVVQVSNDAMPDKRLGLVFLARIKIPTNQFEVGSKLVNLSPGMEVTAEIKTGTRKVWQYFLSPLIETSRESLRER